MEKRRRTGVTTTMNIQSAINKELFIPHDERMLVVVEVQRRKRKRMSFLLTPSKGDYSTFICVSVTNSRPNQLLITKVKQFRGSSSFTRRSQWSVEQLRQVNGINPNKNSPEFDLIFDDTVDQWVANSSAEKCLFVQILYRACQSYWKGKAGSVGTLEKLSKAGKQRRASQYTPPVAGGGPGESPLVPKTLKTRRKSIIPPRQTEFLNCQSKLTRDARRVNLVFYRCKVFLNRVKNTILTNQSPPLRPEKGLSGHRVAEGTIANIIQKINVTLGERGDRLTHAEDKTVKMMHKAQQFADTAHKLALRYSK
ncbi:syntaxin binding protein 6 (amisyn), like isoform X2 [Melanotaenia boesemani]|uniref:syntaxin binding protein 6 (amisyn), like isoform X2 n=1 Tax=Melanotaenia boesemani TaxID=1250792 RepID=UPI001C046514|nr:syntaxin binding protein 6 (amisyn), like isoform X2 [Melanotaenia boesemani]